MPSQNCTGCAPRLSPAQGAAGREIDAAFEQALEAARRHQTKLWELRAATSCGEFWREGGRRRQARDLLEPVYDWFTEGLKRSTLRRQKRCSKA